MKISFYGATREVTGSCYLVETDVARILVDCGMFQGGKVSDSKNYLTFPFDPKTIDAVALSHAHLDHCGRLPKLIKDGFKGKIYTTPPTAKLAQLVLEDAFQIMKEDFEREFRPLLYDEKDMLAVKDHYQPVDYSRSFNVGDLTIRFREAGHIFGSAFVEVHRKNDGRVTFSGDLGNAHMPILRPTAQLAETDILIIESTYGNRIHEDESTRESKLKEVIQATVKNNGVLIIPAFAVERTQQLLFELNDLVEHELIPPVEMYLDSPMAIKATEIIRQYPQYYDQATLRLVATGDDMFDFPGLHLAPTRDQSKAINDAPRPKVIISGSGMMNGGRILHHLVRYLGDARSTVLIVGYQAHGTLGYQLYNGEKNVQVMGERIQVKAKIESIGAYSAHADQNKLVKWIGDAAAKPKHIYCTHGEEEASAALATRIIKDLKIPTDVPRYGDTIEL